jgi:putative copper export protein
MFALSPKFRLWLESVHIVSAGMWVGVLVLFMVVISTLKHWKGRPSAGSPTRSPVRSNTVDTTRAQ